MTHGYDPGTLKRVLRERNRDEHADEIARYMHVSKDCRVGCPGRTIISGGREGADVGEAREVMDRVTDAILRGDLEALKGLYAQPVHRGGSQGRGSRPSPRPRRSSRFSRRALERNGGF